MKRTYLLLLCLVIITACNRAKTTARETISKTGEAVGQASTEFANGVDNGMNKALNCEVQLSSSLQSQGVSFGKLKFQSTEGAKDNVLLAYIIFNKDYSGTMQLKVVDEKGIEYGRTSVAVKAKANTAAYYECTFDKHVNLEAKSKFIVE